MQQLILIQMSPLYLYLFFFSYLFIYFWSELGGGGGEGGGRGKGSLYLCIFIYTFWTTQKGSFVTVHRHVVWFHIIITISCVNIGVIRILCIFIDMSL